MSLVWLCDRCRRTNSAADVNGPPEDWRETLRPIRGSAGARSTMDATLCDACDDALYEWWQNDVKP